MTRLGPITAAGDHTARRVTLTIPVDLLCDLVCDLADATAEGRDHAAEWDDLAQAVRHEGRDDDYLREYYSSDLPDGRLVSAGHAQDLAAAETSEAFTAAVRAIDVAQIQMRADEAETLAHALTLAAWQARQETA